MLSFTLSLTSKLTSDVIPGRLKELPSEESPEKLHLSEGLIHHTADTPSLPPAPLCLPAIFGNWLRYVFILFLFFILCFSSLKTRIPWIIYFHLQQFTMSHRKSKRATRLCQCPDALSTLDGFTMRTFQHQWVLCAINDTSSCLLLILSMDLKVEGDNDNLFML